MKTNSNKSIRLAEARASRTAKRKGDSRAAPGSASCGKLYSTVDVLVVDTCSPEVVREYVRLTSSPKALTDALRMQVHQLEMTMLCGGPSEICGAIDAVETTIRELRELVTPNNQALRAPRL